MSIPFEPRTKSTNVNISKESPIKELVILVGGLALCIVTIYSALGFAIDHAVDYISPNIEKQLGELFNRHWHKDRTSGQHRAEVQTILEQLLKNSDFEDKNFAVGVVDSTIVNAVAVPDKKIIIFSGLLERCKSEDQVAAVLAHELGHFAHRDHLRKLGRGIVLLATTIALTGSDSSATTFISNFMMGTEYSYSRQQELAADEYSLRLLNKTYKHAGGIVAMYDLFKDLEQEKDQNFFTELYRSHPSLARRKVYILDIIDKEDLQIAPLLPLPWTRDAK
jgi:predicted Zn-dependent protease